MEFTRLWRVGFCYGFDFFTCCILSSMFRVLYSVFFSLFRLQRTRESYVYEGNFNHFEHKICQTKPNSEMPKMLITLLKTMTNNKKQLIVDCQKQSQTKPNQTQNLLAIRGAKPKQTQIYPPSVWRAKPNLSRAQSMVSASLRAAHRVTAIEAFIARAGAGLYHPATQLPPFILDVLASVNRERILDGKTSFK
jgi:hypothetical protein